MLGGFTCSSAQYLTLGTCVRSVAFMEEYLVDREQIATADESVAPCARDQGCQREQ